MPATFAPAADPLPCQRHLFDMPADLAYFNAAYMTPITLAGREALARAADQRRQPWTIAPKDFFEPAERVRGLAAPLFSARADDIALVPAVSYAAAIAARNLPMAKGQKILVLDEEFPSNRYPWDRMAARAGGQVESIPGPADRDWTEALLERIAELGEALALVAIPQVHWSTGRLIDLAAVATATRAAGARLFLDLTQSLGALPAQLDTVRPDFAAATAYKWLFGPYGLTYVYVAPEHQTGEPLEESWTARQGAEDFSSLTRYRDGYAPGARRFDMGEKSNFLTLPLAQAGLEQLASWRIARIAASLRLLTDRMADMLSAHNYTVIAGEGRAPHLFGARPPSGDATAKALAWKEKGAIVSVRGPWIRLAPHLWVDPSNLDLLETLLDD